MMTILFLVPYPIGESASQRFRFEQYFDLLKKNNYRVHTQSFWSRASWHVLYRPGHSLQKLFGLLTGFARRFFIMFRLPSYELVFIHRECTPVGPPVFEWLTSNVFKKKIIYDFDDAIWLPNTSLENKLMASFKWHSKVASICRWSYRISAGNQYLADFARQFNPHVVVNPTTVDTEDHHQILPSITRERDQQVVVGWTGTHSTLQYLEPLVQVFKKLEKSFPHVCFQVIADQSPSFRLQCMHYKTWNKETEIADLLEFDIGIMPLSDDQWANGKCGFKALQYMALEIPAVVSSVGVNPLIIDHGINGFLCTTEEDWFTVLQQLIMDRRLREKIGQQGRVKVIESYSVLSNSSNFLSLFEKAVKQIAIEK